MVKSWAESGSGGIVKLKQSLCSLSVVCSDSAYVCNVFLKYLPTWKKKVLIRNAKGQLVKKAFLICAIDKVIHDSRITVYWKKENGHSATGPDKEGNDKADIELARAGMQSGELEEIDETENVGAFEERLTELNMRAVTRYNL